MSRTLALVLWWSVWLGLPAGRGVIYAQTDLQVRMENINASVSRVYADCPAPLVPSLEASGDGKEWRVIDFSTVCDGKAVFTMDPAAAAPFVRIRGYPPAKVGRTNFYGWTSCLWLSNGKAEVVVVPAVNRIMQFRFAGEEGPFWVNPKLKGTEPSAKSWDTPGSFGGDKVWPAPQSLWSWPPPRVYDSMGARGEIVHNAVRLTTSSDPNYGRAVRTVELHPTEAVMRVVSRIEKESKAETELSVWTIAQLRDPDRLFMPLPKATSLTNVYVSMSQDKPEGLVITNSMLSLTRSRTKATKIGADGSSVLWVGGNQMLLMQSPRDPAARASDYPDSGCSVEVYTNPDSAPYVELETLGKLGKVGSGSGISVTKMYRLMRRSAPTPFEVYR